MKISWNKVLIRPDAMEDVVNDLSFAAVENVQHRWVVTGTVVAIPPRLLFTPPSKIKSRYNIEKAKRCYHYSEYYNEPIQVRPGDRVIFDFTVHYDPICLGECILVPYSAIVARTTPDNYSPINGNLLVSIIEREEVETLSNGAFIINEDPKRYGVARVIAAPNVLPVYFGSEHPGDARIKQGDIVIYDKRNAVRLQLDEFNTLNAGQAPIFKLQLNDAMAWIK